MFTSQTVVVRLYVRPDCPLCAEAAERLRECSLEVHAINVDEDPVLQRLFAAHVPVADFGSHVRLYWPFTREEVQEALRRVQEAIPEVGGRRTVHPVAGWSRRVVLALDRAIYGLARHWLGFVGGLLGLYAGLPLAGPLLMAAGITTPANLIYTVYRLFCHQFPSRSSFLLGQQICYCDRCLGTYTTLFAMTLVFALVRRRLKPLPWPAYPLFVLPMAVDGLTQILGWRHSNFELRVITGGLFAIGSAWLVLPYLERGFQDVAAVLGRKLGADR
ncbi:MAG: DUF2085 domain-containing protein [Anaerolineae bacterium]|nr:DUF2085 domain-containing protein [Anaerolineae bacterium]MDW8070548.1 DUF2085 domain-containing protein [Anaerolineae bacterium]